MIASSLFFHSEFLTLVIAFLTGIVGPIALLYVKHILSLKREKDRTKRRDDFNITIEMQQKINSTLNFLQNKYDLDRVWIAQFHNGGNFYPGNKSMKKLSATFEATKPGVSTDLMKMLLKISGFIEGFIDLICFQLFVLKVILLQFLELILMTQMEDYLMSFIKN